MLRRVLTTARRHAANFHSTSITASSKKGSQALVARAVVDLPTDTGGQVLTDKVIWISCYDCLYILKYFQLQYREIEG